MSNPILRSYFLRPKYCDLRSGRHTAINLSVCHTTGESVHPSHCRCRYSVLPLPCVHAGVRDRAIGDRRAEEEEEEEEEGAGAGIYQEGRKRIRSRAHKRARVPSGYSARRRRRAILRSLRRYHKVLFFSSVNLVPHGTKIL